MVGRSIEGLELRRSAANETFAGGTMHLDVTLSTAPHAPLSCDNVYAGNVGADAVQVFVGNVTLPVSPPTPHLAWRLAPLMMTVLLLLLLRWELPWPAPCPRRTSKRYHYSIYHTCKIKIMVKCMISMYR